MGCPGTRKVRDACMGAKTATDDDRIRNANILLVSIKALANEIAKNLVLAGIGSITLADHEVVTEEDLGAQFFISDADVGKNVCTGRRIVRAMS
jgi:molybdopterin/thiamine biosynthesis adenylyltransferase